MDKLVRCMQDAAAGRRGSNGKASDASRHVQ